MDGRGWLCCQRAGRHAAGWRATWQPRRPIIARSRIMNPLANTVQILGTNDRQPAQHSCTNLLACHFRMAARSPNRFDGTVAAVRHLEIRRDPRGTRKAHQGASRAAGDVPGRAGEGSVRDTEHHLELGDGSNVPRRAEPAPLEQSLWPLPRARRGCVVLESL